MKLAFALFCMILFLAGCGRTNEPEEYEAQPYDELNYDADNEPDDDARPWWALPPQEEEPIYDPFADFVPDGSWFASISGNWDLLPWDFSNEAGIGFFYPDMGTVISGISKVYGLAYIDEGWLELDRGVEHVQVVFGDALGGYLSMDARTYVKNRYWIRTFDSAIFPDGQLSVEVTAWDKDGDVIGTIRNYLYVDNTNAPYRRRLFAAPGGSPYGDGTRDNPWDMRTGVDNVRPGDILFLRGGVYQGQDLRAHVSGELDNPIIIMGYPGEHVHLYQASIWVFNGTHHVHFMGIDQSGQRYMRSGAEIDANTGWLQFWDMSFNDNTHPYTEIPENRMLTAGTGFLANVVNDWQGANRPFIVISHSEAKYNAYNGFHMSSIDFGRFQFLEAAHNPHNQTANIFQFKHADNFTIKNSLWEEWGTPSIDNVFLFCYSHHSGQDGWDIRPPDVRIFGAVTHNESIVGHNFGGTGFKLWEPDNIVHTSLNFNTNLVDGSGAAMLVGYRAQIINSAFFNVRNYAFMLRDGHGNARAYNNILMDYVFSFIRLPTYHSIYFGIGDISPGAVNHRAANPGWIAPELGNFFLHPDSPALEGGMQRIPFIVDGVDFSVLDGLGRPRTSPYEVGPYTRLP
ncbi:MAG: hypothetical protein FWC92_11160 [Defluviitaleaceae bacterium]|nr:hypothetical protein [Defluviitaleaceae bacterium]